MTATDELRRLLDERGVKWMPVAWNPKRETFYHATNGVGFCADEYTDGVKIYTDATITPEQAIAATLGSGTCHVKLHPDLRAYPLVRFCEGVCSECGEELPVGYNFCHNCGRMVE